MEDELDEGIPFGIQEEVNASLRPAQKKWTPRGYLVTVETLRKWYERRKDEELVKGVATISDDGSLHIGYKKLAKSLESPMNIYFRYTIDYQTKTHSRAE